MTLSLTQIRQQLAAHDLTQQSIAAFCKSCKGLKEDVVINHVAEYLLRLFGLFYQERLQVIIKHESLLLCYKSGVFSVMETFQLLSQGKIELVRKKALSEISAYATESPEEVLARDVERCISSLPMPIPQAEELCLRHKMVVRPAFLRSLSRKEEVLADLLFKILDNQQPFDIDDNTLLDMERFLFSDCCMIRNGEYVTWMTVIQSWNKDYQPDPQKLERLAEITKLQRLITEEEPPPPMAPPNEPNGGLVDVIIEEHAEQVDKFFSADASFHGYVIKKTLESVSLKMGVEIPAVLLERLVKYLYESDSARKHISYFVNSKHLSTLEMGREATPDAIFVVSAQRFINFKKRALAPQMPSNAVDVVVVHVHVKFEPLLAWLFFASSYWRNMVNSELPIQYAAGSLELTAHIVDITRLNIENCLEVFIHLCRMRDTFQFKEFIRIVIDEKIFPLSSKFIITYLASHFEPDNYDPALNACRGMAHLLKEMDVDSMPGDFWTEVCSKLSTIPDLDAKIGQFLETYRGGKVVNKEDFFNFVIAYFRGTISPQMLALVPRLQETTERQFSFADIVDIFSYPMSPLDPDYADNVVFCCEQLEALEKYDLSNPELGRLFYDFLSVKNTESIADNVLWLSFIEVFTFTHLPKHVALAWMHYRPHTVQVGAFKVTVGKLIDNLFEYRQEIVSKYLNRAVIPYRALHLVHEVISNFSGEYAEPTEAHQRALDQYEHASQFVMSQLGFASSAFNAQLFSEAVSRKALDSHEFNFEDSRVPQRMDSICPLTKDHEKAIYRAWSTPHEDDDLLSLELYLIDLRTLRTYGSHHELSIPWGILKGHPEIFEIIHQAAVFMGEERAEAILVNEDHPGFSEILKRHPKLTTAWFEFKKTSISPENEPDAIFEFIEFARGEDIGIDNDLLEFETYLLFYPKFAKMWAEFETAGMQKEKVASAILNFVFPLKVEFRKGLLCLANALPTNIHECISNRVQDLAYRGHVYPVEDGLSILPPVPAYRTPTMLKRFAITESCDKTIVEISALARGGNIVENMEVPFVNLGIIKGPLLVSFSPLPQGREKVPLNQLTISLLNVTHVVRYTHLVDARNFHNMVRWHLSTLLSKVYGRLSKVGHVQ